MNIKSFFLFLLSKKLWGNILAMGITTVLMVVGVLYWLDIYTDHGTIEKVPNLKGLRLEQSTPLLEQRSLRYEVIDSVYQPGAKPGTILEQLPKAEAKVKKNRIVFLTINAKSPLSIVVPDVRDMSQRQAEAILQGTGFKIGNIEYVSSEYKNLVVDVKFSGLELSPGQKLPIGSSIQLTVGKGYSDGMTEIPYFYGLNQDEAYKKAVEKEVIIGGVFYDKEPKSEDEKAQYKVYRQIPDGGEAVPKGKAIEIYLTKDYSKVKVEEENAAAKVLEKKNSKQAEIDNKEESWF